MIESILARRSIRTFAPGQIHDDELRQILLAGMAAPSALGTEPWVFVVIRNRTLLDRIPEVHPYADMVPEAALAILVCHDGRIEEGRDWRVQDCAAATENLLLAVSALGLGAVWLGVHPRHDRERELADLLALPDWLHPFSLVPIGLPGESKPPHDEFKADKVLFLG